MGIPNREITLKEFLFGWRSIEGNVRLSKTKVISWIAFLVFGVYTIMNLDPTSDFILISEIAAAITVGVVFAIPIFLIGYVFHYLLNRNNSN